MHDIFKGIVVGVLGAVLWFLFSVLQGINEGLGEPGDPVFEVFMILGFALMIGGPVIYIVILPVVSWWRRRRVPRG